MTEVDQIHPRHVQQLELEAADMRKQAASLSDQIGQLEAGRADCEARAAETERLLAHMKGAKK